MGGKLQYLEIKNFMRWVATLKRSEPMIFTDIEELRRTVPRIGEILDDLSIDKVDGMLFDLGVSSPQLDDASRGFSYMSDGPLDMRMDESSPLTACDIVNGWSEGELKRILFDYGEERYAPRIARAIVKKREEKKIETTLELVEIIKSALPARGSVVLYVSIVKIKCACAAAANIHTAAALAAASVFFYRAAVHIKRAVAKIYSAASVCYLTACDSTAVHIECAVVHIYAAAPAAAL